MEQEIFDRGGEVVVLERRSSDDLSCVAFIDFSDGQYCGAPCVSVDAAIESAWSTFLCAARRDVMEPVDS